MTTPEEATRLCIERLRRSEPYDDGGQYPAIDLANALESGELLIVEGDGRYTLVSTERLAALENVAEASREDDGMGVIGPCTADALAELDALDKEEV